MSGTKNQPKGKAGAAAGNRGSGGPPAGKEAQRAARRVEMVGVDTPVSSPEELPRMLQRYRSEVRAKLLAEFGYKNEMQIPKLDKIVINMGGEDRGQEGDRRLQDPQGSADRLQGHAASGPHV